jgi:hypothetical protein
MTPSVDTTRSALIVPSTPASIVNLVLVTVYLGGLAIGLFVALLGVWDLPTDQTSTVTLPLIGAATLSPDSRLLLLAAVCGGLGSFIHAATSFAGYVGNQRIVTSWLVWYYFRPLIGGALAVVLYFVLRAGLIGPATDVNHYGVAALAALAGMFSKQATDKLDEIFKTMFKTSEQAGDAQRSHKLHEHAPLIVTVSPASLSLGVTPASLIVSGSSLVQESIVRVNGVARTSTFKDGRITAVLAEDDVAQAGNLTVTVTNPDGTTSPPIVVTVK